MFQPAQSKAKRRGTYKENSAVSLQKQKQLAAGDLKVQTDNKYVIEAQ